MAAALELAGVSHSHDSVYQKPSRGHGKEEQPANSPSVFGRAEREREARVATGGRVRSSARSGLQPNGG